MTPEDTPAPPPGPGSTSQPTRFQTGRVLTICAAHALHDTYTAFLAPLLPVFTTSLALAKTEAGLLTVFLQGPSVVQPLIGHLADRISLRYLVILAPALAAVVMSLLGVSHSYALLTALLLVAGFTSASIHAVGPVMAGYLSGKHLGRGMGFWMVGGELGRTLGPLVIVTAVGWLGMQGTPWLMLGGLAITALLFVRLRDVPGRAPGAPLGLPWRQALGAMGPLLLPLAGIILMRSFMVSALTTYLPLLLSETGASLWMAGASLTILEAAGVGGALLGGAWSDRLGRRTVLLISFVSTPLFMFGFLGAGPVLRIVLLVLMGFTALSVTPVVMAMVQENLPHNRALANGVYMALSFGLRSGVVVIYGGIGDLFGLQTAFTASAVIALIGSPLVAFLPRRWGHAT